MPFQWQSWSGRRLFRAELRDKMDTLFDAQGGEVSSAGIPTVPTAGNYPVVNLFVDATTGNLQYDFDDSGGAAPFITSQPTGGNYAVTNLFVDSATGRLVVQYEDGT